MNTIPKGGFNVAYFQNAYRTTNGRRSSTSDEMKVGNAFRKTHREPRVLTTKSLWPYVWNGISCTCCVFSSQKENIDSCEGSNEAILEQVREKAETNLPYDFVYIEYDKAKHDEVDKLIREVGNLSPKTKVILLTKFDGELSHNLRERGYYAMSGNEMMIQRNFDMLIAKALGDEGIVRLKRNYPSEL